MVEQRFAIDNIPAVLYGERCDRVYLFVHGKDGYKEEAEAFAALAAPKGWQVLGTDLPGHGERRAEMQNFDPWHAVPELQSVMNFARAGWGTAALRANSIGAWFSMLAFHENPPVKSLFVSPVLDMAQLIRNMMTWAGVTEEELFEKRTIGTSFGQTLEWDYYEYAKKSSELRWNCPTEILYAGNDNLTSRTTAESFALKNGCRLTVMENGEHWFHTPEQLEYLKAWEESGI